MAVAGLEGYDLGTGLAEALIAQLCLRRYPMIAFTGGGGKTSLMFSLARALSKSGRAVVTTTTKLFPPRDRESDFLFVCPAREAITKIAGCPRFGVVTAASAPYGEKLVGYTPQQADDILKSGVADWVLVEADGARRKPLKAYETWEPPVPPLATMQFVVAGADALTAPLGEETVYRFETFAALTGMKKGGFLSAARAAALFSDEGTYLRHSPANAVRVLLLNKAELLDGEERKALVAGLSNALQGYDRLIAASVRKNEIYADITLKRG